MIPNMQCIHHFAGRQDTLYNRFYYDSDEHETIYETYLSVLNCRQIVLHLIPEDWIMLC